MVSKAVHLEVSSFKDSQASEAAVRGCGATTPPGPFLPYEPRDGRQIWLQIQHMVQSFWKRWRADYINQLQSVQSGQNRKKI